jgi:hypothetical protein
MALYIARKVVQIRSQSGGYRSQEGTGVRRVPESGLCRGQECAAVRSVPRSGGDRDQERAVGQERAGVRTFRRGPWVRRGQEVLRSGGGRGQEGTGVRRGPGSGGVLCDDWEGLFAIYSQAG